MAGAAAFHRLLGKLDHPMYIVTAVAGGERSGCLVEFGMPCSVHPPRFLVCLSDMNHTRRVAGGAQLLAVHVVPADREDLARLFGEETGDRVDKFERCAWRPGPGGLPVLAGCPTWFAGRTVDQMHTGDHQAFLLEPTDVEVGDDDRVFTIRDAHALGLRPGHPL